MCVCIAMFPDCVYTGMSPTLHAMTETILMFMHESPNEDGLDALFGDVLLWKPSSVCPWLLALNKVPSHKITSELSFGWQWLSIWVVWSSDTSRTKPTLSKCFTIKMDLEKVWFLEGILRAKSDFSFVLLRREWSQHIDKIILTESRITDYTGERWDHLGGQDLE